MTQMEDQSSKLRIGIVGAESSHTLAFARTLNIDKACGSARVVAVWGERREFAEKAAREGHIPEIVRRPEEMLGRIDGVMIAHRHPKYHIKAAWVFLEAGIPLFIDKPFSFTVSEGMTFLKAARQRGVPVTSFSILPEQKSFRNVLLRQIRDAGRISAIQALAPCDFKSKWGGVFFYGIHLIEMLLKAFGCGIEWVEVVRAGRRNPNVAAVMHYGGGGPIVSALFLTEGFPDFAIDAIGSKGRVHYVNWFDPNPYLGGVKKIVRMFRTRREPYSAGEILGPISVLEALARSYQSGKRERMLTPFLE
jgi:predicted dehydrogenase